ncbi:hypothetical protein ACFLS1_12300 [Verrucomicrobiota bacterium]
MKKKVTDQDSVIKVISTKNPTIEQVRMMALYLWMIDTARDPEGKDKFLALEKAATEHGYDTDKYCKRGRAFIKNAAREREEGELPAKHAK